MSWFRTPFDNKRVSGFQTLLKTERHHYYPTFPWSREKLSVKKSTLAWSDILWLFVNTFTADGKYSRHKMQNFSQQLQTPFSQKEKAFSGFLIVFLKCARNLKHCDQKDEYPGLIISEIIDSKTVG